MLALAGLGWASCVLLLTRETGAFAALMAATLLSSLVLFFLARRLGRKKIAWMAGAIAASSLTGGAAGLLSLL